MKVNFVDLKEQYRDVLPEALVETGKIIASGNFMGAVDFEKKFAEYVGARYCVGLGSGTDALVLALLALGIGPGDEVIVPANTYIATAFAVSHVGAKPVFIDPDPATYVIRPDLLDNIVTPNTKAIIPVHLYGYPVNMEMLLQFAERYRLFVVEDCAQSVGAKFGGKMTGSFGQIGCYSFYPTKNLGGLGQGGAIVTDDEEIARTIRELGNVGRKDGSWFEYNHVGFNSRLDAINAKFLEICLEELDNWTLLRGQVAEQYNYYLSEIPYVNPAPKGNNEEYPVYHLYEIECVHKGRRDGLKNFLELNGVQCGLHYPIPCHRQLVYKDMYRYCPIADFLSDNLLSLPMHPFLKEEEIKYVCDKIEEYYELKRN